MIFQYGWFLGSTFSERNIMKRELEEPLVIEPGGEHHVRFVVGTTIIDEPLPVGARFKMPKHEKTMNAFSLAERSASSFPNVVNTEETFGNITNGHDVVGSGNLA